MKRLSILFAILGIAGTPMLFGTAGRDQNVCSLMCAGNQISCRENKLTCGSGEGSVGHGSGNKIGQNLNFAGDVVSLSISKAKKQNLGLIATSKPYNLIMPAPGQRSMVAFRPTKGRLANKEVRILLVTFAVHGKFPADTSELMKEWLNTLKNESRYEYYTMIYRQIEGERQWTEIGEMKSGANPAGTTVALSIKADATVTSEQPLYQTFADGNENVIESGVVFDLAAAV